MSKAKHRGLHAEALSKAAEIGVKSQLEKADKVDIDIDTDPLKLVQGEVNSVEMRGEGLITAQNLRLEEVLLKTDQIAINLLNVALGKVELTHPANAKARITLTTADINRVLNSDYLRSLIQKLDFPLEKDTLTLFWEQGECHLHGNNQLTLNAQLTAQLGKQTRLVAFSILLRIDKEQKIYLEKGSYQEGKSLPLKVTIAILEQVENLLKLRNLRLPTLALDIDKIEITTEKIVLWAEAQIEQIPNRENTLFR
ncbi:MAG: DUF2993 domain-containing protein [Oscillatoria sp. PMC 1068.18]|nr:DUF2993 domain-containing protein [Oscillatoria sp. PMC 1076.18]MEC4990835.1 DUF2993 domain-containing protein [Oscillatoria sp. PMC 1068.18]